MRIALFILLSLFYYSCASVYVPSVRNAPLFSEKGEFQATASVGNGLNVNAAYALTNHLAISVGGVYANNKMLSEEMEPNTWRVHQSVEGALGFYRNNGKRVFEIFGGYGVGNGHAKSYDYNGENLLVWLFTESTEVEVAGTYHKFFIQPSIGYKKNRFQFIGTLRLTNVDFKSISLTHDGNPIEIPITNFYMVEPSFTVKVFPIRKTPSFFILGQAGMNFATGFEAPNFDYSFLSYHIGIGISLHKKKEL